MPQQWPHRVPSVVLAAEEACAEAVRKLGGKNADEKCKKRGTSRAFCLVGPLRRQQSRVELSFLSFPSSRESFNATETGENRSTLTALSLCPFGVNTFQYTAVVRISAALRGMLTLSSAFRVPMLLAAGCDEDVFVAAAASCGSVEKKGDGASGARVCVWFVFCRSHPIQERGRFLIFGTKEAGRTEKRSGVSPPQRAACSNCTDIGVVFLERCVGDRGGLCYNTRPLRSTSF